MIRRRTDPSSPSSSEPVAGDLARVWITVSLALVTILGVGAIAVVGISRLAAMEDAAARAETATAVTIALRDATLAIQDERSAAERWLGTPSAATRATYVSTHDVTDRELDVLMRAWDFHRERIGEADPPTLDDLVESSARLPELRDTILRRGDSSSIAPYGGVIDVTSASARRMEVLASDSTVATRVRTLVRIIEAGIALSEERDVVFEALAGDSGITQDELIQIAQLEQRVRTNLGSVRVMAGDITNQVAGFLASMRVDEAQNLLSVLAEGEAVTPEAWYEGMTARLSSLRSVGEDVEQSLTAAGEGIHSAASRRRLLLSAALVGLTAVSVLAGVAAVQAARQRSHALKEYGELAAGLHLWFSAGELETLGEVRLAARYDAVSAYTRSGGDWYDAYRLGDGRLVLTVGDVAGHGADATAQMAMIRNLLRGIALGSSGSPAAHLGTLDVALGGSDTMATVFHAVLDVESGVLTYARAGHPAALLRQGGVVTQLDEVLGSPVGIGSDHEYVDARVRLVAPWQLVAYTDGLVEVRGGDVESAIRSLAEWLATASGAVDVVADDLLAGRELRQDDTALIVVGSTGPGPSVVDAGLEERPHLLQ